ncbi:hypothetical protein [Vreelandella zhanjiangensis]|uniref:hypothetical protein n=1 Tax=Vreelandella zhanjiangensis TaxID=1121960 RepID=UPI000688CC3E|nr:hypothetical protein [Halomonas zhanjiangensis]
MKWYVAGLCLLIGVYVSASVGLGLMKGYPWKDMDWNENGKVGLAEVMRAKDIGMRELDDGCKEYFYYKDGLTVRLVCPSEKSKLRY